MDAQYISVDADSVFGIHVNLSPEVHNAFIVLIVTVFFGWAVQTFWKLSTIRSVYNTLKSRRNCLHLPGMAAYAHEFQQLQGLHVTQVLRLKCITPFVVVPRMVVPASIDRTSIKVVKSSLPRDPIADTSSDGIEEELPCVEFDFCSTSTTVTQCYILANIDTSDIRRHAPDFQQRKTSRKLLHGASSVFRFKTRNSGGERWGNSAATPSFSPQENPLLDAAIGTPPNPLHHLTPLLSDTSASSPKLRVPESSLNLDIPGPVNQAQLNRGVCDGTSYNQGFPYIFPPSNHWTLCHRLPIPKEVLMASAGRSEKQFFVVMFMAESTPPPGPPDIPAGFPSAVVEAMKQPYLFNIPAARAFAQVTELKVVVPNADEEDDWKISSVSQVHFGSLASFNTAVLIPTIYYSTFNQANALELLSDRTQLQQYTVTQSLDDPAERNNGLSGQRYRYIPIPDTTSGGVHPAIDFFTSSVSRFLRRTGLGSLPRSSQWRSQHREHHPVPAVIPPTPHQWKEIMEAQEDFDIFGFRQEDENDCIICMSAPKEVAFLPCRHSSCCARCLRFLRQGKCPLCRQVFSAYVVLPLYRSLTANSA